MAGVAQLVEHLICNQRVGGSNPFASSRVTERVRWVGTHAAGVEGRAGLSVPFARTRRGVRGLRRMGECVKPVAIRDLLNQAKKRRERKRRPTLPSPRATRNRTGGRVAKGSRL